MNETWRRSQFRTALLQTTVRTDDLEFIDILNLVREGKVTPEVTTFLNSRMIQKNPKEFSDEFGDDAAEDFAKNFNGTVLFPHRETTERYNLSQLKLIEGQEYSFETIYSGDEKFVELIMKNAPVPQKLILKIGALVMIRQNDPQGRWFNGSLGYVRGILPTSLKISLLDGRSAELEKSTFSSLDAEGREIASAINFPVNLAYAATIHKAQGMTLDRVSVDLSQLWEPGQAYVALSRAKSAAGLFISKWSASSIKSDPVVAEFNRAIWDSAARLTV